MPKGTPSRNWQNALRQWLSGCFPTIYFLSFFTVSLFRLISCCFSKLKKELNEHRQTTKLLVYQGLFRLSLLYIIMAYFCHTVNQRAETAGRQYQIVIPATGCRPAGAYHLANYRTVLRQKRHLAAERHHRRLRDLTKTTVRATRPDGQNLRRRKQRKRKIRKDFPRRLMFFWWWAKRKQYERIRPNARLAPDFARQGRLPRTVCRRRENRKMA